MVAFESEMTFRSATVQKFEKSNLRFVYISACAVFSVKLISRFNGLFFPIYFKSRTWAFVYTKLRASFDLYWQNCMGGLTRSRYCFTPVLGKLRKIRSSMEY